ncbi:unnamed protein product [Paramecium octaurelia]|uniref:Uncharacterized protein n=1 Tax=Paramecium octaurelia TaxID=43137 RepID=A0A8S1XDB9_PAROT|nr:unnamed protein product [Paramecium octaurelia]
MELKLALTQNQIYTKDQSQTSCFTSYHSESWSRLLLSQSLKHLLKPKNYSIKKRHQNTNSP